MLCLLLAPQWVALPPNMHINYEWCVPTYIGYLLFVLFVATKILVTNLPRLYSFSDLQLTPTMLFNNTREP